MLSHLKREKSQGELEGRRLPACRDVKSDPSLLAWAPDNASSDPVWWHLTATAIDSFFVLSTPYWFTHPDQFWEHMEFYIDVIFHVGPRPTPSSPAWFLHLTHLPLLSQLFLSGWLLLRTPRCYEPAFTHLSLPWLRHFLWYVLPDSNYPPTTLLDAHMHSLVTKVKRKYSNA